MKRKYYCQSDIEDRFYCDNQCDHCKEYYKSLIKKNWNPKNQTFFDWCLILIFLTQLVILYFAL